MIHKLSCRLASILTEKLGQGERERSLYRYGIEVLIGNGLTAVILLILACFIDSFVIGLLYLALYIPLKVTCGGYHAETQWGCTVVSLLNYVAVSVISRFFSGVNLNAVWCILLLFFSTSYIFKKAPVKNIHHPVKEGVAKKNKRIAVGLLIIHCITLTLRSILVDDNYILIFSVVTLFSVAAGMAIARILQKRNMDR